jgi:5-methylcytosine-specific restriction enzyme A
MPSLRTALGAVLASLPQALSEAFAGHSLGKLLTTEARLAIGEIVIGPGYKIQGSPGRGRWAETVWVAVFDRLETETAQRGIYPVYLFPHDGRGVYLSLNQGTTIVRREFGRRRYLDVLHERASLYADLLKAEHISDLQLGPLDLGGSGDLTLGYQAGNVAARYYPAAQLSADATLGEDLKRLMGLYTRLLELKDSLDEDGAADAGERSRAKAPPRRGGGGERSGEAQAALEAKQVRWHLRVERTTSLVREAKRLRGTDCEVCAFNYGERYGELGEGYIEAHHRTPIADLKGRPTELDPATDFAVVCASCHRMIHRRRPPLSLAEVRNTLR